MRMVSDSAQQRLQQQRLGLDVMGEQRAQTGQAQQYELGRGALGVSQAEQGLRERAFGAKAELTPAERQTAVANMMDKLLPTMAPDIAKGKIGYRDVVQAAMEAVDMIGGGGQPGMPRAIPIPGGQAAQPYIGRTPFERRPESERLFGRAGQGAPTVGMLIPPQRRGIDY